MPIELQTEQARRQIFFIFTAFHLAITFFSYQGPALAGRAFGDRLRIRDSLQDKVLGLIVGGVNGYLIVGTIWSFLEYYVTPEGWLRLPPNLGYPFDLTTIVRPPFDSQLSVLIENLPLPLLAPYLPFLVVIVFLFVIVVMI